MSIFAFNASSLSPYIITGGIISLILPWSLVLLRPRSSRKEFIKGFSFLTISLLFISLLFGQLVRLPLPGQGGGLLASDVALILVIMAAFFSLFRQQPEKGHQLQFIGYKILLVLSPFLVWSLFSLIINSPDHLDLHSFLIASAYWVRLAANLLLLPALLIIFSRHNHLARFTQKAFYLLIFFLVLLGFAQLTLFPDLHFLANQGWDPHQNRLLSTWLDPNFFGGFLAMVLPVMVAPFLCSSPSQSSPTKNRNFYLSLLFTLLVFLALVLTQSRSAWLALFFSLLITSPILLSQATRRATRPRLFIYTDVAIFLLLIIIASGIIFWPRVSGLIYPDATVTLRLLSLKNAWPLAEENYLIGVGYNAYQFSAQQTGLISNHNIHSRAGSDNSTLNTLVTTGLLGLSLLLFFWAYLAHILVRLWLHKHFLAGAALFSVLVFCIQSQFINAFFYSHLLITSLTIIALGLSLPRYDH
jgi:hypothetical protein